MKILLDTHVFIWFITGDSRLTPAMRSAIDDPANEVVLSVVSIWEAIVKHRLGKLTLTEPPTCCSRGNGTRMTSDVWNSMKRVFCGCRRCHCTTKTPSTVSSSARP